MSKIESEALTYLWPIQLHYGLHPFLALIIIL